MFCHRWVVAPLEGRSTGTLILATQPDGGRGVVGECCAICASSPALTTWIASGGTLRLAEAGSV